MEPPIIIVLLPNFFIKLEADIYETILTAVKIRVKSSDTLSSNEL